MNSGCFTGDSGAWDENSFCFEPNSVSVCLGKEVKELNTTFNA